MNNLLSYCGLTDARISVSEKDLPVKGSRNNEAWLSRNDLGSSRYILKQFVDRKKDS